MAAPKKKRAKKQATQRSKRKSVAAKKWKAPKNTTLSLLTFPFRLIFNSTSGLNLITRWPLRLGALMAFGLFCLITLWAMVYMTRAQFYEMDHLSKMPARSMVYAADGKTELGRLHGDNRYVVKHKDVSPHFIKALLAQEDEKFESHGGVDLIGLFRIPFHYLMHKKVLGASTITMQLARNTYPLGNGIDRKLMEIAVAYRIESSYEKNEILEHYMNRIFFGHSMYGVEAASRTYFEKPSKKLTLSEAAMLAGIIRGPNLFSPFKSLKKATRERDRVLDRMVAAKFISKQTAEKTKKLKLNITPRDRRTIQDTYVMDIVDQDLKIILEKHNLKMGNLKVYTTIDHRLQKAAERHIESEILKVERSPHYRHQTRSKWQRIPEKRKKAPNYLQAGMVCIENRTGAILSIAGGRNAKESRLNRATHKNKRQQLGSIIKPFVYLSAFSQGMPNYVKDTPIRGWTPGRTGPHNHDGKYLNSVSVIKALAESRNCAAVHAGRFAGKEAVSETLRLAGFSSYKVDDGSFYLGSGHATPWEVASAYTIFANGGKRYRPFIIKEIRDQNENVVYSNTLLVHHAAKTGPSWRVSQALRQVTTTGTARALQGKLKFRDPCGGKTGTSSKGKDAWFAGYTASISCAVWVGHDRPVTIIKDGEGSSLALPIWAKIMNSAKRFGYPMIPKAIPVSQ